VGIHTLTSDAAIAAYQQLASGFFGSLSALDTTKAVAMIAVTNELARSRSERSTSQRV
jgi:hypothetical protein